jgi:two-component system sensor histidine kinase KdpD
MRTYRVEHVARAPVWKAQDALLVAIGPQGGDEGVVRSAARLASALDARWHAVYVETPQLARLPDARRRTIMATLKLAEELGAQTATLSAPDATTALLQYARAHNLGRIVVGRSTTRRGWLDRLRRASGVQISALAADIDVTLIGRERAAEVEPATTDVHVSKPDLVLRYGGAAAICAVTTLVAFPLQHTFDLSNTVMLFLLAVVAVAVLFGRGPAVAAAIVNVLAFDFFFVPPQFTFAVSDVQYVFTFAVMLAVGLVIGQLTARLRHQARFASDGEQRARRLFEMSRELSAALAPEQVAEIGEQFVRATVPGKCAVQILEEDETLRAVPADDTRPAIDDAVARWVLDHAEPAGLGTDTLPTGPRLYLPLKAPVRTRGVLALEPVDAQQIAIPEQRRLLETCAALIAIALERVHFVTVAQRTLVEMESERLRNSVLAAISHDIRTPLTALVGLSDALARKIAGTDAGNDAAAVRDQARRTAQMVDKLLDMARLEAGQVKPRKEWQSLDELVGSALRMLEHALEGRRVEVSIPADVPLVSCDGALIERVLVNLLENAAKYTPPPSPIGIVARKVDDVIEVAVEDRGPGLPRGREDAMFEKFTRGDPESSIPGVGLGLAICRAIVSAHGGSIRALNRDDGGARFVFTLPAGTPPAIAETDAMPSASVAH